ncbi:MAG: Flp family type IVb pilin [Pseudomonadota bacterium]
MSKYKQFLECERGATAMEYALIIALLSMGVIAATGTVGGSLTTKFESMGTDVKDASFKAPEAKP